MGKLTWNSIGRIYGSEFGLTPNEAAQIISNHIFSKNWYGTKTSPGRMWQDQETCRALCVLLSEIGKHEKKTKYNLVEIHRTEKSGLFIQTTKRRCAILKSNLAALKKSEVLLSLSDGRTFMFKIDNLQYVQSGSNKQRIDNMMIRQITQEIERTNRKLVDEVQREFIAFVEGFTRYETEISSIIQFVINTDVHLSLGIMAKQNNYWGPVIDEKDSTISWSFFSPKTLQLSKFDKNFSAFLSCTLAFNKDSP